MTRATYDPLPWQFRQRLAQNNVTPKHVQKKCHSHSEPNSSLTRPRFACSFSSTPRSVPQRFDSAESTSSHFSGPPSETSAPAPSRVPPTRPREFLHQTWPKCSRCPSLPHLAGTVASVHDLDRIALLQSIPQFPIAPPARSAHTAP